MSLVTPDFGLLFWMAFTAVLLAGVVFLVVFLVIRLNRKTKAVTPANGLYAGEIENRNK